MASLWTENQVGKLLGIQKLWKFKIVFKHLRLFFCRQKAMQHIQIQLRPHRSSPFIVIMSCQCHHTGENTTE